MTNKEIDHIIACEIERMSKASNLFLRNGYMECVYSCLRCMNSHLTRSTTN